MLHFPEPFELPPGFGLRQPSGALSDRGGDKAVEGHRTAMTLPRRRMLSAIRESVARNDGGELFQQTFNLKFPAQPPLSATMRNFPPGAGRVVKFAAGAFHQQRARRDVPQLMVARRHRPSSRPQAT